MAFQDKWKQYKERQEAKKYFRSHNDQFLDSSELIKTIGGGVLVAIATGIVLALVISTLHITSSLFYLISAYIIATAVTRISQIHSQQIAIISVVLTFLGYVVSEITMSYLVLSQLGIDIGIAAVFQFIIPSIKSLFVGDLFTTIVAVIGLFIAYEISK